MPENASPHRWRHEAVVLETGAVVVREYNPHQKLWREYDLADAALRTAGLAVAVEQGRMLLEAVAEQDVIPQRVAQEDPEVATPPDGPFRAGARLASEPKVAGATTRGTGV